MRPQTLRNWEEDRAEPRANRLQMLAGMLDVSLVWLISGLGRGRGRPAVGAGRARGARLPRRPSQPARRAGRLAERLGTLERRLQALLGLSETAEIRLRRLRMRSCAARHARDGPDPRRLRRRAARRRCRPATLDAFETLLSENDQDIYQWISGQCRRSRPSTKKSSAGYGPSSTGSRSGWRCRRLNDLLMILREGRPATSQTARVTS